MGTTAPILDLNTLAPERPTIRLVSDQHPGGRLYELRVREEFGVQELVELGRLGQNAQKLYTNVGGDDEVLSDEQAALLETFLDDLLRRAFVADYDAEIKPQLNVWHKVKVAEAFSTACFKVPVPEQA